MKFSSSICVIIILLLSWLPSARGEERIPILLYHRFGPVAADSMTVTTDAFESQMKYLKENGFTVIRLRQLVDYYLGKKQSLPPRSLVITFRRWPQIGLHRFSSYSKKISDSQQPFSYTLLPYPTHPMQ